MDIRVKKTRRSIVNAFMELRAHKPLEKITVKELCERAEINKSTFYTHFTDVFDLSEHLEDEVIEQIMGNLFHPEYVLEQPKKFAAEMLTACEAQNALIENLFSGSQNSRLIAKLDAAIRKLVFKKYPHYQENPIVNIYLNYTIFGGYYAMQESNPSDKSKAIEVIGSITERSFQILFEQ